MTLVPLLVRFPDEVVAKVLHSIGEHGNSREIMISVHESLERISRDLAVDTESEEASDKGTPHRSPWSQLMHLAQLCITGPTKEAHNERSVTST